MIVEYVEKSEVDYIRPNCFGRWSKTWSQRHVKESVVDGPKNGSPAIEPFSIRNDYHRHHRSFYTQAGGQVERAKRTSSQNTEQVGNKMKQRNWSAIANALGPRVSLRHQFDKERVRRSQDEKNTSF